MRIMAIDYGEQRIGIAMTDLLKVIANPYDVYHRKHTEEDFDYFINLIKTEQVDTIVMGLPLNMQGEEQEIALSARAFGDKLQKLTGCKLVYLDERMTSFVAEKILKQFEPDWKKRKAQLDKYAAMVILQDYLDSI